MLGRSISSVSVAVTDEINSEFRLMQIQSPRQPTALFQFAAILFAVTVSQLSFGQDNVGNDSTVVYSADYFAEYSPVSAQDMLDRIPGIGQATGGNSRGGRLRGITGSSASRGGRGLGGGSSNSNEILINGKRTAGKNNQTSAQLNRITADQVNYIEIIRGTSGGLDIRGSGQLVNVVLFEELSSTSISYKANMSRFIDHETEPGGSVSFSGQTGALNFVLSASATPGYGRQVSKESSILGDFSANDRVREERINEQTTNVVSANLNYEISPRSSLRFNALFAEDDDPTAVTRLTTDLRVTPNTTALERESIPIESDNWEIGGDYELLTPGGDRFKILFISNEDNRASTRERYDVFADGSEQKNLFLDTASVTWERIVRGSYTFDVFEGQDIEVGVERAQTILESKLALGIADSTGIASTAFGGLVPVAVSNANSSVEEIRYEPFIIHNWIINPRMSLETTLLYETSEIEQSGDVSNTRDFDFVKPKLDFRYDLTPQLQLRGTIEKEVNQLSFSDFVAANDEQDDDSNTQAGNANLRQEWLWKYDFNAEYRLPNDIGVVDANLFYHQHHDVIERIDVSSSETDLQSANGNIGDGERWGLTLNTSIRMRMINLPNLLLTSRFSIEDSSITDPFLGIDRRFQFKPRGFSSFGFRHDLPRWNLNWGGLWMNRLDGNIKRFDIDDIEIAAGDPRLGLFVEYIDSRGITYRFDAEGVTNNLSCRERQRFVGRMSAGILEEIEDRCNGFGRILRFGITGTF
jgi:hypothetical protein